MLISPHASKSSYSIGEDRRPTPGVLFVSYSHVRQRKYEEEWLRDHEPFLEMIFCGALSVMACTTNPQEAYDISKRE